MKTLKFPNSSFLSFVIFCLAILLTCTTSFASSINKAKDYYQKALKLSQKKLWDQAVTEFRKAAELTLKCLNESVPNEVPGIAFLSGGQTEIEATKNLDTINKKNKSTFIMSYSYGRALQQGALKYWSKNLDDIEGTQKIFNHRANMCSLASQGKWTEQVEKN